MAGRDLAASAVAERVEQGATSRVKALVVSVAAGAAAGVLTYRLLRPRLDADAPEG
jgi:hypothetical protein